MKRSVTPAQRDELQELIDAARACAHVADLLIERGEAITGEDGGNSETHNAVWNQNVDARYVLKRLGIAVRRVDRVKP